MNPARRVRRGRGEQGAVLFVSSVLVVAMIALAALGVDIANVWQVRRHAQNAADAAALAAAQDLPNLTNAIATAKTYAQRNFNVATGDWAGCRDSGKLAMTPDMAGNDNECISFSSDSGRVRVKIPSRAVGTFFGGVIGVASFQVQAGAIAASVVNLEDRMIPAAVTDLSGTGLVCVEQAGNNQPCSTRERGRFGSLKSPRLNAYIPSGGAGSNDTLAVNYAMSLDHNVIPYTSSPAVCDGPLRSPCVTTNDGTSAIANHLVPSSGNDIPPVTEGFVTGFTANTTDYGSVEFCGRLQRPDITTENLLQPKPDNCNNPGVPTTQILGRTVNGRHVYHWMNDVAKQKFYPEVWALGLPETDQQLAIGNSIYADGDLRLDCFLAGYRFDTTTGVETIPDCRSVDLVWPGQEGVTETVGDTFSAVSYSNNDGAMPWAGSWIEGGGDDGTPTGSRITISSNALRFSINGSVNGRWITRVADLQGATTASLSFRANASDVSSAQITVYVSPDGTNFTPLTVVGSNNANGWTTFNFPITAYASSTTYFALQVTQTSNGNIYFDDVEITYSVDPVNPVIPQVAPIFELGIRNDTRWAVVPLIPGWNGNDAIPVQGFWASFAYTAYVSASKVQAFDAWVFDPALIEPDPNSSSFVYGFSPRPTARLVK